MKFKTSSRSDGFIRLGCLGYFIAIALIIGGAQRTYTALKNREPVETTVTDYLAQRPNAEWVTFKNATLNLVESAHLEKRGKITEVFIPIQDDDAKEGEPVHILLSTKDKEIIAALDDMVSSSNTEETVIAAAIRNASKLVMKRDVSGLIRFGMTSDDDTRDKLAGLDMNLAKDFVILNDGEVPALVPSLVMLVIGLAVGFFMVRRSAREEPAAPTPPPLPPNLPPRV